MAGINTLQEAYKKRGEGWTRDFLTSELKITEKTEAYRFSFELSQWGKLRFYGKNGEQPLNRIDRTVSDLYENAITKIEKLPEAILINLPKSHRFGFNWSQEGGLALTDITVRQRGKVTKQIHEKDVLHKWANLLHVNWGDDVLQGKLEETTVESLLESLRDGKQPSLGNINEKKTYIIRGEHSVVKIAPAFVPMAKTTKSHTFDLLLMQIYEHLQSLDFSRFAYRSERSDERYIEIVCEAFNRFVDAKGNEYSEMGIEKPHFLEKSGKFNKKWVRNQRTLELIEGNTKYEYLLSVFLTNLRKPKKATGLLTESFVENFNEKIYELESSVRDCEEFGFPEFSVVIEKETKELGDSGFSEDDSMRAVGMMQSFFAQPFHNTNEEEETIHEANLLYMNLGDFTNRALRECEAIMKKTGKGFVIVHDERAGSASQWGLSPAEGLLATKQLVKDHPHIFESYDTIQFPSLQNFLRAGGERKIKRLYTGRGCDSLLKECETHNMISGKQNSVEISKLNANNQKEIEECMHGDDFVKFKQLYPESIQKFWSSMHKEWQSKAYM